MKVPLYKIYLDYAASTPVDLSVQKAMLPYFASAYGNPESAHFFGQEAVKAVDLARENVARTIGANFHDIVFTSSATESNNLAIRGAIKAAKQFNISSPRLIISTVEHDSVLETARDLERDGIDVVYLPVDKSGTVNLDTLEQSLDKNTVLISVIYVNNVTGAIQPIQKISNIIHDFRKARDEKVFGDRYPLLHIDAVQAFQYYDCDVNHLCVDLMTLSAHKLYGPKGVGVLYCKDPNAILKAVITGGGQEFGLRSSTHNVPAIVGCAEAFRKAYRLRNSTSKKIKNLRTYFINELKKISPECEIHDAQYQSPGIISVYIPELPKNAVTKLSDFGVAVSAGSACSSHSPLPSRVLRAMGVPEEKASGSIRISLGKNTTRKEVDQTLKIIKTIMEKPV
ncbi:MAG: hypothetical protein A3B74_03520 [Candidatus Kerfeldbacteria bacterium RIFCSPHIGHO2_02_FULL_42_14]|uniref:cysteine desulfurase n=1 Tax=Candidatus Kerfeldbacteria bacterium RIFCSPHIGHO2_02_FULL_42_14 TaxID=1798540 RepID=A0A1G2AQL8_9BACT|nr:MAG: hypothetical protein A3B74_03520 [Candidatus Kerfeldbacteria bacterium RIFCSPHIGHO2_02_FULL_42_14]OGY80585.1 MAG: hypothetical protein A3E60_04010 [Candidatus Kerfeldbacteria bacterium RIFCSPHIGHO2_12_FULL_42_13]OGY87571.1 MAG: hypothetical protein A3G01_00940 [Candidatus Kerfeldbacteria bacterium RIFCSPLOWO2_12_FULL_43_9]